jgi:hypothetical protein
MADNGNNNNNDVFIYRGGDQEVPRDVTHAIVDPSVDNIRRKAFFECRHLVSLEMHDEVKIIERQAIQRCSSLRKIKLLGVRVIESSAFGGCTALEEVEFGDKLETIEDHAFATTSLRRIKIPKLRVIEDRAFLDCEQLTEVELSEDLEEIGEDLFAECPRLRRIAIPLKEDLIIRGYVFNWRENLSQIGVIGGIHNTISSLFLESWKSDMYVEIDSINQVLPNTDLENKTKAIKGWIRRALGKMKQYKSAHYALLKGNMTQLELALWKANLPNLDAAASRHDARVTCSANIIIPLVLPFLNDEGVFPFHSLDFDLLGAYDIACVFSFLPLEEMRSLRNVSKKFGEVAKLFIDRPTDMIVNSVETYNKMKVMTAVPLDLQRITIDDLGSRNKWSDGEDPNEGWADYTADYISHDIEVISNFRKLRILEIRSYNLLNGRYPALFNFPQLQKLSILDCDDLRLDLEMLAGFPILKELVCECEHLTGSINSLKVLKDTLEKVKFALCHVEGNFMDLADFPHLKELDLQYCTAVTGDIRDIGKNDFPILERLCLPDGVYGGIGYEFDRLTDAPDLVQALYLLVKRRPALLDMGYWYGMLSFRSPDYYKAVEGAGYSPPFCVKFIQAGPRTGYQWESHNYTQDPRSACEVNWLDPELDRESSDYGQYMDELQQIESRVDIFSGFHQPPSEDEYRRLFEESDEANSDDDNGSYDEYEESDEEDYYIGDDNGSYDESEESDEEYSDDEMLHNLVRKRNHFL